MKSNRFLIALEVDVDEEDDKDSPAEVAEFIAEAICNFDETECSVNVLSTAFIEQVDDKQEEVKEEGE